MRTILISAKKMTKTDGVKAGGGGLELDLYPFLPPKLLPSSLYSLLAAPRETKHTLQVHVIKKKKTKDITKSPSKKKNLPVYNGESIPHGPTVKGHDFFVVAIGASAGGLEAFKEFLTSLPADTGMSFVFIQHLSPEHKSLLPEILSRFTPMPVKSVVDGVAIKKNVLYIIPPGKTIFLKNGIFKVTPRKPEERPHHPIDRFMESLAHDMGSRAIGVVLSGTGTDGAEGTRIIKAEGGVSFAQSPISATYESMPISAISADDIDFILDPQTIAHEIGNFSRLTKINRIESIIDEIPDREESAFENIMKILRKHAGTDFGHYKPTTIRRRIARRMIMQKIEKLSSYLQYLEKHPVEIAALKDDVLINVTSFFRDPQHYLHLQKVILPSLLKNRSPGQPLRIWSAGCSTGEETYSLAISVLEVMGEDATPSTVQIFGTDLSEKCIDKARTGKYLDYIATQVSEKRLNKYFTKIDHGYRISKQIRDLCVFAKHDITRDPSYSKIDLISCKNLLIYLGNDLQQKVIENFHYSLNPHGFLCLGSSESTGKAFELFNVVDAKLKVYSKKSVNSRIKTPINNSRTHLTIDQIRPKRELKTNNEPSQIEIQHETERAILARFSLPCVVINGKDEILQFRGNTDQFLVHKHGEATLNILRMSRDGLATEIKNIIAKVRKQDVSIRSENIPINDLGPVNIEAIPLKISSSEKYILIVFEVVSLLKSQTPDGKGKKVDGKFETLLVSQLKQELSSVKDNLHSVVQDFENANQELQSAHEEVLSSNEELQSTNEELETSKEELQSANEELTTVNDELQERNLELFRLNNDLLNVLNSVQLPIVIVGNDLHVRRYTSAASKIFNLIPSDVGRPFTHISSSIMQVNDITRMVREVLEHAVAIEKQILAQDGKWYQIRIRPYKTEAQKLEGAVISIQENNSLKAFLDVTNIIIDMLNDPFVVLDHELRVTKANNIFYKEFKLKRSVVENKQLVDIAGLWGGSKLKKILNSIMKGSKDEVQETLDVEFPKKGKKRYNIVVKRVIDTELMPTQVLLKFETAKE